MPRKQWRCLYCDEVFTTKEAAAEHFGSDEGCYSEGPACKLNEQAGGLLKLYREALAEIRRLIFEAQEEQSPLHKALWEAGSKYERDTRAAEEKGYAKGVAEMKLHGYCTEPQKHV